MLKLVYTPTTEIKESDLVPGSKWRRKSDGAECVLLRSASAGQIQWCLAHNGDLLWNRGEWQIVQPGSMLTWLSRDFERVGEDVLQYKTVGEVPVGWVFDTEIVKRAIRVNTPYDWKLRTGWVPCLLPSHNMSPWRCDSLRVDDPVTRVYGPIEIDESVKGVG